MHELVVGKSYWESLAKLSPADQARANAFVTRYMKDPANPGTSLERVTGSQDSKIWSARITRGLRAILHKDGGRSFLLYAGQHDDAYDWAGRRKLSIHPTTGAVQIVETVESVEQEFPQLQEPPSDPALFPSDEFKDDYLISLGLPEDWLPTIRRLDTEDELLAVAARLPEEVGERLLALFTGDVVTPPKPAEWNAPLAQHPDTQRRFFLVQNEQDLAEVLEQPLEAWVRFLHPSQRSLVEATFNGPAKVTGSAGTGKTVVALHRARALARKGKRVLVTSYVNHLCRNLERQLGLICRKDDLAKIEVSTVHHQAYRIARTRNPKIRAVDDATIHTLLTKNRQRTRVEADEAFLPSEWTEVIDRQGLTSWEAYRDADRRGRGRPLTVRDREKLWQVFSAVWTDLELTDRTTWPGLSRMATEQLEQGKFASPFDSVIVDEVQDLQPAAVKLLAALGGTGPDGLMLVGDAGQRIYPGGFSLRSLGIDVRGRSHRLRINYRTTEQIQRAADRLLGRVADDLDEGREDRRGTVSLLRGPQPGFHGHANQEAELAFLSQKVQELTRDGLAPREIAVFARTRKLGEQARDALRESGLAAQFVGEDEEVGSLDDLGVFVSTMHGAKGLEFKAVLVAFCDERRLPNAYVLGQIEDPAERESALARERSLLYVSMTRARDELHITWHGQPSPFVQELMDSKGDS